MWREPDELSDDDSIPWRAGFSREGAAARGPWRGTGALKLSLAQVVEFYSIDNREVANILRDALRIMRERGWSAGRSGRYARAVDDGPVTPGYAVTLATREAMSPSFNIHVAAKAALEHFLRQDLDEWNRERDRTVNDAVELFLRAIFRADNFHSLKAS